MTTLTQATTSIIGEPEVVEDASTAAALIGDGAPGST